MNKNVLFIGANGYMGHGMSQNLLKNNKKDLIEIPETIKKTMEIVPVKTVEEVLKHSLVKDLKPEILDLAPKLGDILVPELIKEIGSGEKILAYGKAGVVGLKGEIEHASAFIHTLRFGNKFRDAVGGTSYLSFTNTRGAAGCKISILLYCITLIIN